MSYSEEPTPGTAHAEEPPAPAATPAESEAPAAAQRRNMLPGRERRRFGLERLLVRLVATTGIVGIGVALGAILESSNVQGWIIGLVVAGVSVILSAILWSSRQL
jgi:hypothetical protein